MSYWGWVQARLVAGANTFTYGASNTPHPPLVRGQGVAPR